MVAWLIVLLVRLRTGSNAGLATSGAGTVLGMVVVLCVAGVEVLCANTLRLLASSNEAR